VANDNSNTIEEFTLGGVGSVFANSGLNSPQGLAFDSAGNLYAANYGGNTIEKFTPGGVGSVFANTGLSNPTFLAFATPEPSTWAMFASGIGISLFVRLFRIRLARNVALRYSLS
jgi:DNA-binding beta-propeller fold protein YncE